MEDCRYCSENYQTSKRIMLGDMFFIANFDNHPVSPGHMKIIPKKHINSLDELTDEEMVALRHMVENCKALINQEHHPQGYNFGYNEGEAAGQTVFHLHFHLIPRYKGDVKDPIGGIRNVVPEKGNYLKNS